MNATRGRTPKADLPPKGTGVPVATGAAKAIEPEYQPDGDGLGEVGRRAFSDLLDSESDAEEQARRYVKFPPHWRALIRWFDENKLATWREFVTWLSPENFEALKEIVADHREKQALRRFWARIFKLSAIAVPIGIAWAQGFFDKALPLIRSILKLLQGGAV